MKKLSIRKKQELLKKVIWDYHVSPDTLMKILVEEQENHSHIDRKYLINRCFNYLNWYQFVSLFTKDELIRVLKELNYNSNKHDKLNQDTRLGLEFAKQFLRRETISDSG